MWTMDKKEQRTANEQKVFVSGQQIQVSDNFICIRNLALK